MISRPLQHGYRAIGLLPLLSLLVAAIAALLHHFTSLPHAYTWLQPIRTLRDVVAEPNFPAAIVVVFLVGRLRLRGAWKFTLEADQETLVRRLLLRAGAGAALIATDALVFEHHTLLDAIALMVAAGVVTGPRAGQRWRILREVVVAALVFLLICYAFTVFKALVLMNRTLWDARIVALEHGVFGVRPHRVMADLGARHPGLAAWCDWAYFHFFPHMALVNVFLVGLQAPRKRIEYLGALAICYIVGGPLYWVFPGLGPSYHDPEPFRFLLDIPHGSTAPIRAWLDGNTHAVLTGKAKVLHTWGYIACMPSLHVAHEVVMLWYARRSRLAFVAAAAFTGLTIVAVMVLGWHYPTDAVAGVLVGASAIGLSHRCRGSLLPRSVMPPPDPPLPPRPPLPALLSGLKRLGTLKLER
ncbi:MAG: phosphatase PAP2 family protein [Polyangiaceae bacterium]